MRVIGFLRELHHCGPESLLEPSGTVPCERAIASSAARAIAAAGAGYVWVAAAPGGGFRSSPRATLARQAAIAAGSSAPITGPPTSPATLPASVPAASATTGRSVARYSNSL